MSFAEDYTFDADCGDQVTPLSADYQDMVSFLHVDAAYRYCVSAVAPAYMVDTAKMDGSLVRHSNSACATHTVEWVSLFKLLAVPSSTSLSLAKRTVLRPRRKPLPTSLSLQLEKRARCLWKRR